MSALGSPVLLIDGPNVLGYMRTKMLGEGLDYGALCLQLDVDPEDTWVFCTVTLAENGLRPERFESFRAYLEWFGANIVISARSSLEVSLGLGDVDRSIKIKMLELAKLQPEYIVLFSGDGGFIPAIEEVQLNWGVPVVVVAFWETLHKSLLEVADLVVIIDDPPDNRELPENVVTGFWPWVRYSPWVRTRMIPNLRERLRQPVELDPAHF